MAASIDHETVRVDFSNTKLFIEGLMGSTYIQDV